MEDNDKIDIKKYVDLKVDTLKELMNRIFELNTKAVDQYSKTNDEWKSLHNGLQRKMEEDKATFVSRKDLWLAAIAIVMAVIAALALIKE